MGRKSAASAKIIKPMRQEELAPLEEVFETGKQGIILIVETNIVTAKRVDNLLNIRDYALKFFDKHAFDPDLSYYKDLQQVSIETYEKILEVVKGMTLEQFEAEELDDLLADIIPPIDEIDDEHALCRAGIIFLSVKPYGSQLIKLHTLIQDEIGKRKAMEQ